MVKLEVACVYDDTFWRLQAYAYGVRNAVVRFEKGYMDASQLYLRICINEYSLRFAQQPCFLQLAFNQSQCQLRGIYRNVKTAQHIGKPADMIFMSMRNDNAAHLLAIFLQIR